MIYNITSVFTRCCRITSGSESDHLSVSLFLRDAQLSIERSKISLSPSVEEASSWKRLLTPRVGLQWRVPLAPCHGKWAPLLDCRFGAHLGLTVEVEGAHWRRLSLEVVPSS